MIANHKRSFLTYQEEVLVSLVEIGKPVLVAELQEHMTPGRKRNYQYTYNALTNHKHWFKREWRRWIVTEVGSKHYEEKLYART